MDWSQLHRTRRLRFSVKVRIRSFLTTVVEYECILGVGQKEWISSVTKSLWKISFGTKFRACGTQYV